MGMMAEIVCLNEVVIKKTGGRDHPLFIKN